MSRRRKLRDDPAVKLIRRHGYLKVQRAMNFAASWAWVAGSIGHDPTITEFVEYFGGSRSSAFNMQAAFREVTGLDSPRPLLDRAGLVVDAQPGPVDGLVLLQYLAS